MPLNAHPLFNVTHAVNTPPTLHIDQCSFIDRLGFSLSSRSVPKADIGCGIKIVAVAVFVQK